MEGQERSLRVKVVQVGSRKVKMGQVGASKVKEGKGIIKDLMSCAKFCLVVRISN